MTIPDELLSSPAGRRARPTVGRYLVVTHSRLPRLTHTVRVAETVRAALQSKSESAGVFSGRTAAGEPVRGHGHASYFCEADPAGRLRHVTVHAPMGFDDGARAALGQLVEVRLLRDASFRVALTGVGRRRDFAGLEIEAGRCPLFAASRVWVSQTPFVPTRHPKVTRAGCRKLDARGLQIGSAEHDLRRLLAGRLRFALGGARARCLPGRPLRLPGRRLQPLHRQAPRLYRRGRRNRRPVGARGGGALEASESEPGRPAAELQLASPSSSLRGRRRAGRPIESFFLSKSTPFTPTSRFSWKKDAVGHDPPIF